MTAIVTRKNLRTFEGIIDGAETVTANIPCQFLGPVVLVAYDSTFGDGTLTIEHLPPGATTWFQWGSEELSADGAVTFYPPAQGDIRLKLTDGAAYDINWRICRASVEH